MANARSSFRFRPTTPAQSLLLGFALLTLAGSIVLTLPIASAKGTSQPFIDAFFTATSAVTTTGLVVVDTGSFYSLFGQIVILMLFQVGGLGYLVLIALLTQVRGSRLSIRTGVALEESIAGARRGELKEFVRSVFLFTLFFEALGAVLLTAYWTREFSVAKALYLGIFHSVSAFCTAGFGLFSDSFSSYRGSVVVNLVVALVTIAGGIGFFVLRDVSAYWGRKFRDVRPPRLSVHSKLTLIVSGILMLAGSAIVFIAEPGLRAFGMKERLLAASFQALSASTTTGFNTVDIGLMTDTSIFALIILMFVGSAPGGTGGGIKTTTLGVVLASVIALLNGGEDTVVFRRRLTQDTVYRALTIGLMATVLITGTTLILTSTETTAFLKIVFEVVSAFGTVGLSTGITSSLTATGKFTVSIVMFIGRLGPLAVGFALLGKPKRVLYRYAEDRVFVG